MLQDISILYLQINHTEGVEAAETSCDICTDNCGLLCGAFSLTLHLQGKHIDIGWNDMTGLIKLNKDVDGDQPVMTRNVESDLGKKGGNLILIEECTVVK